MTQNISINQGNNNSTNTASNVNMKLPPLDVSKIELPKSISVNNSCDYENTKQNHQQVADAFTKQEKTTHTKQKIPTAIKAIIGLTVGFSGYKCIEHLVKKI